MSDKKDKFSTRLIFGIFGILIVAFVVYHTFGSAFEPYECEEVAETTVKDIISADCFIVRKENIITSDNKGYKVCKVSNGGKVAKNSDVISFYEKADDVAVANEIYTLESYLKSVEEIDKQNSIHMADLDIISEQTEANIYSFLNYVDNNNFSDAQKVLSELRYYMAQGQLATGREDNYSDVIDNCQAKLDDLKKKYNSNVKTVKSEYSGYFVNFVDGYESAVDYDNVEDITVSQIESLKPKKIDSNQVGRVIIENEWYIVTVLDTVKINGIAKGDKLDISTSLSSVNDITVKVAAINRSDDGKKSAVVLSCMEMNEELATIRQKNMQIVLKTHTGLKVNSKAIRFKDGKKGVYVELGATVKFVPIDVIYNSADYVIVKSNYGENQLKIYDDVIVKGKNLDG